MGLASSIIEISVGLFLGMLAFMELGRRIALSRMSADPEGFRKGVGAIEATTFALLGLLIAFTLWGASGRLDTRRHLMVEEANAIVTAYMRVKMLPQESQQRLRESFRRYLEIRLDWYRNLADPRSAEKDKAIAASIQAEIWNEAVSACRNQDFQGATMLLLPAINNMINMMTTQATASRMFTPETMFRLLFVLAIISSMMAGYAMAGQKKRNWTHTLGYCAIIAFTVFVILDLEYRRHGPERRDSSNQALLELKNTIK